ncbi:MAG: aminopeptidase P family protein [Phycisphaerae bacterium]|nr:aminopeptidase P family protein [Phycisphaerae bacterium]
MDNLRRRVWDLRRRIQKAGIDGLLVVDPKNVTYLTGFLGEDSWLLVTDRKTILLTDSRYIEQARQECPSCRIVLRKTTLTDSVAQVASRAGGLRILGVEPGISVDLFRSLRNRVSLRLRPVGGLTEGLRQIKDSGEVRFIRRAADTAWAALAEVLPKIRSGVTESAVAGMIEYAIRQRGLKSSFDPIVCFGPNGSRNHHQPGQRKLKGRDTILIDFGAKGNGYICDLTRSFAVGEPSQRYRRAWQTVFDAQQKGIGMICPGTDTQAIDAAIRKVIADNGFPVYGHGSGHGIGLAVHEGPFLSPIRKGQLLAGQILTIEPGIYLPGEFGIRIEDDILVTEEGHKVLSRDSRFGFSADSLRILKIR